MTRSALLVCAVMVLSGFACSAAEPLHRRIDQLIAAGFNGEPAALSNDAEFFRRVNLDLAGRIPSAADSRAFLDDSSPDKRAAVIDRLLASPEFAGRMANLFHVMLMERRGDNDEWNRFLETSLAQNKPWDQIVHEILKPNPEDESLRGAAYFYTRRLEKSGQQSTDFPGLTRDVGRLFLGVDLQCAECHDHLFIDDYKQRDFQGLFAVYQNVSIRSEKFPAINEKTMTAKLSFVSVFDASAKGDTGPRIPFGKEFEIPDPPPVDPAAKKKRPDPNDPPTFSALSVIADSLPSSDNHLFRRNIANRLWFCMMGRGLVEPLDQFHSANQATHPELLEVLADEFAAHHFDIKWMIREITLSETWQRSSRMGDRTEPPPRETYQVGNQRRLTAEQLFWSTLQATGNLDRLAPKDGEEPSDEFKELQSGFVTSFASEPKEPATDYTPAVKQALFLLNDSKVLSLLKPQPGNLIGKLLNLPDEKIADELFLSIFCRLPDDTERTTINDYLKNNADRRAEAMSQLAWAMLTSIEFAVNH
ncbi:MAG: DUF1553 domain-containing protein [Planctomycetota bacterium]|nr:DUF1553 domain-containing protein [Planctomycetota bacterium]